MDTKLTRRNLLKIASASLALIPLVIISRQATAKTNSTDRDKLKYQDTPKEGMICSTCLEFVPGKTGKDFGGCKVIPGDNEISPNGYCVSWNTM